MLAASKASSPGRASKTGAGGGSGSSAGNVIMDGSGSSTKDGKKNGNSAIRFSDESSGSTTVMDDSLLGGSFQEGWIGNEVSPVSSSDGSILRARKGEELSGSVQNLMRSTTKASPGIPGGGDAEGARNGLNSTPSSPVAATEDDAKWHDCIKAHDWAALERMIKKFDSKYYKKKQRQAREQKELELRLQQEEEEARAAAAASEGEVEGAEGKDGTPQGSRRMFSLRKFPRLRSRSPATRTSDVSPSRSSRRGKKFLPIALSGSSKPLDPSEVISPLLTVDPMGRTPLHLACLHKAPESMLLDLLAAERKAAQFRDKLGQLPLHCAVQTWQFDHVLEKIIKSYPNALKTKDNQGRTAVGLAVQLARQRQEEDGPKEDKNFPFLWSHPTSKGEKNWQFRQEKTWSKVNYLLRDLMKRNKSVIPSEHGLIMDALEGGADPNTINRLVSTADKYLMADDELAGTAIGLCVERNYCLDTLTYLMDNCRERTTIITDSVHKAVLEHYRQGCIPRGEGIAAFGKQVIDWTQENQPQQRNKRDSKSQTKERKTVKDWANTAFSVQSGRSVRFQDDEDDEEYKNDSDEQEDSSKEDNEAEIRHADAHDKKDQWLGMDKACRNWWETLNHLLYYCAYGRHYKETVKPRTYHLLHAALAVSVVPPSLIQLLLIAYPEARNEMCPLYRALPVHIACTRWKYDVIRSSDDASLDRVLKLLLKPDPEQVTRRHKGRLPIHLALSVGQSWTFIKPFVLVDKKSVGVRDPYTKFFPFQMAALPISSKNIQLLMRNKFLPADWRKMSVADKKGEYKAVEIDQCRKQVGTIFELLRRHPDAIIGRPLCTEAPVAPRSLRSAGMLSMHYLSFVYGRNAKGEFKIRSDNVKLLRDSIVRAEIPPEIEAWWEKLKEIIWNESVGDIPKTEPYLLHAALYNTGTPPLVVELLLQLFPSAATKAIPGTKTYPLHIAAGTMAYQRHPFEIPYGMDNLHLVLLANQRAIRARSHGRLPLHICLARGKTWKEVRPLVKADPTTLLVEDAQSRLLPFQLIASFKLTSKDNALRYAAFIEKQTRNFDFYQLSARDKAVALSTIQKKLELNQLTCIFEILRHRPSAMTTGRIGRYGASEAGSAISSAAVSITSRDDDLFHSDCVVGSLGQLLNASTLSSAETLRGLTSPTQKMPRVLAPFLVDAGSTNGLTSRSPKKPTDLGPFLSDSGSITLSAPSPTAESGRPSLSVYLTSGGVDASARSLASRTSRGVYSDYVPPTYDDDAMSNIGESPHSPKESVGRRVEDIVGGSSVELSSSTKKLRRGKRPSIPIALPDLDA
jgi:hypothetical protein